VVLLIVLADVTIYRGHGYAGVAALLLGVPILFLFGYPKPRPRRGFWIVGAMLWLLAARLIWLGEPWGVATGLALIPALALAVSGRVPDVMDSATMAVQSPFAGIHGLVEYIVAVATVRGSKPGRRWLSVLMPLAALCVFGGIFILANPDVVRWVERWANHVARTIEEFVRAFAPDPFEVAFWIVVGVVSIGLLRPLMRRSLMSMGFFGQLAFANPAARRGLQSGVGQPERSPLYPALRNTLGAVIVLFAVYLCFEYVTLWFREFSEGFYYGGYAHEGAAWLTVVLALATGVLSAIFRGPVLRDPRTPRLRRLAWFWSAENLLLALAVYNRLFIYIKFNGMTRMRTVALFGISVVVVGFLLVVLKIIHQRGFRWLVRSQLWALAVTVFLYCLTPVDAIVHGYNARRIVAGDLPPAVQITVHPINAEGILALRPLVDADNEIIREGVRAMLAQRAIKLGVPEEPRPRESSMARGWPKRWTAFQFSDRVLADALREMRPKWEAYVAQPDRQEALARFSEYAYQWY